MAAHFHLVGETIAVSAINGKKTYLKISAHTDKHTDKETHNTRPYHIHKTAKKAGGALGVGSVVVAHRATKPTHVPAVSENSNDSLATHAPFMIQGLLFLHKPMVINSSFKHGYPHTESLDFSYSHFHLFCIKILMVYHILIVYYFLMVYQILQNHFYSSSPIKPKS